MFPNVRLMIAAVAASIIALGCGFGLFAAFRVSHEPLARMPAASVPLQFAASSPGLAGWAAAAVPVSARPTVIETALTDGAVDAPPDDDSANGSAPVTFTIPAPPVAANAAEKPAAAVAASAESQPDPALPGAATPSNPLPDSPAPSDATPVQVTTAALATQPVPTAPAADNSTLAQDPTVSAPPAAPPSDTANSAKASEPSAVAANPDGDHGVADTRPPAAVSAAVAAVGPDEQAQQTDGNAPATPSAGQQSQETAPAPLPTDEVQPSVAEAVPLIAEAAPESPAPNVAEKPAAKVVPKTAPKVAAKAPRKVVRRVEPQHHAPARRVARRTKPAPPAASYQAFGDPQPNFQSAPQQNYVFPQRAYVAPQATAETKASRRRMATSHGSDQAGSGGPFVPAPPR